MGRKASNDIDWGSLRYLGFVPNSEVARWHGVSRWVVEDAMARLGITRTKASEVGPVHAPVRCARCKRFDVNFGAAELRSGSPRCLVCVREKKQRNRRRKGVRPARNVDLSSADWRWSNETIARYFGCHPDTVRRHRPAEHGRAVGPKQKVLLSTCMRCGVAHADDRCRTCANRAERTMRLQDAAWKARKNLRRRLRKAVRTGRAPQGWLDAVVLHLGDPPEPDWQIDHVVPLAAFDLTDPGQLALAVLPENHRWAPPSENCSKQDTLPSGERGRARNWPWTQEEVRQAIAAVQ